MSTKYVINQIHRFNFLAVNDFRVNLRGLHVGMAEQFARGIKVRSEGKHHRGERVAGCINRTLPIKVLLSHGADSGDSPENGLSNKRDKSAFMFPDTFDSLPLR